MKKRGCLIAISVIVGLIVLVSCCGIVKFLRHVELSWASPYLFVSVGVNDAYQAHFVTEGFQDRGIDLYVYTASDQQNKPEFLATLVYPRQFANAVWSRDGSVIACQCAVAKEAVRKTPSRDDDTKPTQSFSRYVVAYDFQNRKSYVLDSDKSDHPLADWVFLSKTIDELLESRGGAAQVLSEHEIEEKSKKLNWDEWQWYKSE